MNEYEQQQLDLGMEQTPPAPPPIEAPPPVQAETPAPPVPPVSAEPAVSQPSQETEVELVNDELGDIVINPDIAYQLYDPSISESQYTRLLGQDNFHEIDLGGPLEPLDFNDKQAVGIYNKAFAKHQSLIEGTESDIMYGQIVGDAAGANDISSAILAGVFHTESRYNKNAGTYNQFDKSAQGPFQFTQQTADHVGLKNRNSVIESANAASKYLRELLDRFDGDIVTALRAYNAGPGAIEDMQNRFGVNYLILTDKNGDPITDTDGEYIPITENHEYPEKVLREAYKYGLPINTTGNVFLRPAFKFGE